jgi:sec-independent protein translocase protein TatB
MFDVAPSELMLVALVALVVIGPKDLPKAMRFVGYWVSRARGVMGQFRAGFDTMIREAELKELEAKWAAENERIMREFPSTAPNHMLPMRVIDQAEAIHMVEQPALHYQTVPTPPLPTDDDIAAAEGVPTTAPDPASAVKAPGTA